MIFHTITGSTYEVDVLNKKIRRLNGAKDPTPRMGKDGEWRDYKELRPSPLVIGESALIVWGKDVSLIPETQALVDEGVVDVVAQVTTTSPIKGIVDERMLS